MAAPAAGAYGEPVFPEAAVDTQLEGFVRYKTSAAFADVAGFYERAFKEKRWIFGGRSETSGGEPVATWAPGVRDTEPGWGSLVVMTIPPKGRRPSAGTYILVTKRA